MVRFPPKKSHDTFCPPISRFPIFAHPEASSSSDHLLNDHVVRFFPSVAKMHRLS